MSIIKVKKHIHGYVILQKQCLEDPNLSWGAKGLWAYLMGRVDAWEVSVSHLASIFNQKSTSGNKKRGGGVKAIREFLAELIAFGYAIPEVSRKEKGYYSGINYIVFEVSQLPKQTSPENIPHPRSAKRNAVERNSVKDTQTINKNDSNDLSRKNDITDREEPPKRKEWSDYDLPPEFENQSTVLFNPKEYVLQNGEKLTLRTARAFDKYSGKSKERLIANVKWYESQCQKGVEPKTTHEKFLQWAINSNMASSETFLWQNEIYAKVMKEQYNLRGLNILKTCVHVNKFNGNRPESIDLRINPECFAEMLKDYITLMERK